MEFNDKERLKALVDGHKSDQRFKRQAHINDYAKYVLSGLLGSGWPINLALPKSFEVAETFYDECKKREEQAWHGK